jgi:hypothetical protein
LPGRPEFDYQECAVAGMHDSGGAPMVPVLRRTRIGRLVAEDTPPPHWP